MFSCEIRASYQDPSPKPSGADALRRSSDSCNWLILRDETNARVFVVALRIVSLNLVCAVIEVLAVLNGVWLVNSSCFGLIFQGWDIFGPRPEFADCFF